MDPDPASIPEAASGRIASRLAVICWLSAILLVYFFFVTYGTGRLDVKEVRSEAYDSLAKSLLRLEADVDPKVIGIEGFQHGGKTYMYFGPWPAMVRIPLNAVWGVWYGRWSRVTCLIAALLALIYFTKILLRSLQRNQTMDGSSRRFVFHASLAAFAFGTPLFYLICCARIYNEACLWALSGALAATYYATRLTADSNPENHGLVLLSLFAGITLLSRASFAIPFGILFLICGWQSIQRARNKPETLRRKYGHLLIAASVMLAFLSVQLWYNNQISGSPLTSPVPLHNYPGAKRFGTFYLPRIPETVQYYFGFTTRIFSTLPPFVVMATPIYYRPELFFGWKEPLISLTVASCYFVLSALAGLVLIYRERSKEAALMGLCFLPQIVLILSYYFLSQRFTSEFLPAIIFLFSVAAGMVPGRVIASLLVRGMLILLTAVSIYATVSGTISEHFFYLTDTPANVEWASRLTHFFFRKPEFPAWSRGVVPVAPPSQVRVKGEVKSLAVNRQIHILGYAFPRNLIGIANTAIMLDVPPGAVGFRAVVAIPDEARMCHAASSQFAVVDNFHHVLYESGLFFHDSPPAKVETTLPPKAEWIGLEIRDGGDGTICDWLAVADPQFLK